MSFRGVVTRLHRWPGLVLAVWFACVGLSGSMLVFWRALEDVSYPATTAVGEGAPVSIDRAVEAVSKSREGADVYRVFPPFDDERTFRAQYFREEGGRSTTAHVDPASGRILGKRRWGEAAIHVLYEFHSGLIFGRVGQSITAFIGLGLGVLALLGFVLWFFRTAATLAESLIWRRGLRGLRRWRNIHRSVSIWATVPLVVAAITGGALHFPEFTRDLIGRDSVELPAPRWAPASRNYTLADLSGAAESAMTGWRVHWIDLPAENSGEPYLFIMRRPGAPATEANGLVIFHGRSGALIKVMAPAQVEGVRAWLMALHNGSAFGPVHRGFVVVLGFTPAILGLSGFAIWLRRRKRKASHAPPKRAKAAGPTGAAGGN